MPPFRLFWLGILIGVLGALAGIVLSSPQTDASALHLSPPAGVTGGGEGIFPDLRWLDLVRAASTAPAPRDPATCVRARHASPLPATLRPATLHVHLTDRTVAGRVPYPTPVTVRVRRGETTLHTLTVQPVPDGEGYLYIAVLPPWGSGTWLYGYCGEPFLPGDVFWAVQGNTVLSLTLPSFSVLADPDADLISGTAPPSETVALYLYPRAVRMPQRLRLINALMKMLVVSHEAQRSGVQKAQMYGWSTSALPLALRT